MISGVPLFRGRDNQDQLLHIMRIIGTPDERTLRKIATEGVSGMYACVELGTNVFVPLQQTEGQALKQYPRYPKIPFSQILPKAAPQGVSTFDAPFEYIS